MFMSVSRDVAKRDYKLVTHMYVWLKIRLSLVNFKYLFDKKSYLIEISIG